MAEKYVPMTPAEIAEVERNGFVVLTEPRTFASISKLAELMRADRATVRDRLKDMTYREGVKGSRLYPTDVALHRLAHRLG